MKMHTRFGYTINHGRARQNLRLMCHQFDHLSSSQCMALGIKKDPIGVFCIADIFKFFFA